MARVAAACSLLAHGAALWAVLCATLTAAPVTASDAQAWAYHPNNVQTDTVISNVFAGVRLTLQLSRQAPEDAVSTNESSGSVLTFDDRVRVISDSIICGGTGSARSTESLIRFPLPGHPLQIVNASEVEILDIRGVNATEVNATGVNVTLSWLNLALLEVGRFRICFCAGFSGHCDADAEFGTQVGEIHTMGPADQQAFKCAAGWPCGLGPVSGDMREGNRLRVMSRCFPPLQTTGFLPGTGVGANGNETADLLNDPAVSDETTSTDRMFSWGPAEVLGLGNEYELCWCAGHYEGCNRTENFLVRAGSLTVPGPARPVEVLCAAGRLCHFAVASWLGVDLGDGDRIMALPNCRGGINVTVEGFLNDGITEPASFGGRHFLWDSRGTNLTSRITGSNRLCWCHRSRKCEDSDEFRLDVGQIAVAGPRGDQSWLCTIGQSCAAVGIWGTTLAVDDHYLLSLTQCGVQGNVSGFAGGHVVASSVQPAPSTNSSTANFKWGKVTASTGSYQLCWAPSWQRPSEEGCSDLKWDGHSQGSALTCAQTKLSGGTCAKVSIQQANTICSGRGSRLCLPHEILQGEARATKCATRSQWFWTSQSCGPGSHAVAQPDSGKHKCVVATTKVSSFESRETLMSWACCADDEGIGSGASAAWFADSRNFMTVAGTVNVRGPVIKDAYCAVKDVCLVGIQGLLLNQGADRLQIIQEDQSCGTSLAVGASKDFVVSRANASAKTSGLEEYDLGKSATFGIFHMCWCSLGQSSCNQNIDFNVNAGKLLVGGINEQSVKCIFSLPCLVPLNGTNLGGADSVIVVPTTVTCSEASRAFMKQANVTNNPATTRDVTDTSVKTFNLGGIQRQGSSRICYCIQFGTRACVVDNAPIISAFSLPAGFVTIYGAFLNTKLPNGRTGVPYSIAISGSQLSILNRITVQRVGAGPACGALGSNISDVAATVPTNAPTSITPKGTETSWYGVIVARAGLFRVCWCVGGAACKDPSGFSLQAGSLVVDGIQESITYPTQIVGNPFELSLYGNQLRPSDRVVIAPRGLVSKCGVDGTSKHMAGRVRGVSGVPPTSKDVAGVTGAEESWRDVGIFAVGEYVVCWCGHTSCTLDVHFTTEAGTILVTGPQVSNFQRIVAGESFDILLHGSGLGMADRISIVDATVNCGSVGADLLHGTVVAPVRPSMLSKQNTSNDAEARTSSEALGPPRWVARNRTSQVWNSLMIRWEGTYKLCWAGNHSFSRRCTAINDQGNCTSYRSAFYPFQVGTLTVIYGNASVVGQSHIARCDSLDVMAFSPQPPLGNSTQLSALSAVWTCSPSQGELCTTLQTFLTATGAGKLHLYIPPTFIANMLDRARWVASSFGLKVGVQSFVLSVIMIDTHNVTRWGSLPISISNLQPLVRGAPTNVTITLADELHLALYINPPGGIICSDTSVVGVAPATITWRLISSTSNSAKFAEQELTGSIRDLFLSPSGVTALGIGEHNISALVDFADSTFATQEVLFYVRVVEVALPTVVLRVPSNVTVSCPFVVSADTSLDGTSMSATLSHSWSCKDCSKALAPSSGSLQLIQGGSLMVGRHRIEARIRGVNGLTKVGATNISIEANITGKHAWPFLPVVVPQVVRSDEEIACQVMTAATGSSCIPPSNVSWYLRRVHKNGSSVGMPDAQLSTRRLQFNIGTAPALRLTGIAPFSAVVAGGYYRCILRAASDLVHTSSIMFVVGPPSGGRIVVAPSTGTALQTRFTLTSVDWQTEQIPMEHAFMAIPGSSPPDVNTSIDVGRYLRGWDLDNVMGCVLGNSGHQQMVVRVRDTLGAVGMAAANLHVDTAKQPINYDVGRLSQWPPTARSLTVAAASLVMVASDLPLGASSSRDRKASAKRVGQLLTGLWDATQSASIGNLQQEDLALRAWVLERTLLLAGSVEPSLTQCSTAAQILERLSSQAASLGTITAREPITANTSSRLLVAASVVSLVLAKQPLSSSRQSEDRVLSLLRGFDRHLGEALLLKMRRSWSPFENNTSRFEQIIGAGMSTTVGQVPRARALAGIQVPASGLSVQVDSVVSRRLSLANETLKASCHSDTAELQLTRWQNLTVMSAAPLAKQVRFEGSFDGLKGSWVSGVGKSDPLVATVRLWLCPEGLQHVDKISLLFQVPGGTMGHGSVQEVLNGTVKETYHINVTWVCAQWDHTLGLWRSLPTMVLSLSASSIKCVSRLSASHNAVHLAAFPSARTKLYKTEAIESDANADALVRFSTENWLPLIIAAIGMLLPLIFFCMLDAWDPPCEVHTEKMVNAGGRQGPNHEEAPPPQLVFIPSTSLFEGLWYMPSWGVCTWSCTRRRRKAARMTQASDDVPDFMPSPQDQDLQMQTTPPLRKNVDAAAQDALHQLADVRLQKESNESHLYSRSSCCCFKKDLYASRQRTMLMSALSAYRSLLVGSDHYRRAIKQFGLEVEHCGDRMEEVQRHLDVDICEGTGVDRQDEALVLRVAHHVQNWLGEVTESPEGIRLGGEEELTLKCCQQALRHAFIKASAAQLAEPPSAGLQAQPYIAPAGAVRVILVSKEIDEDFVPKPPVSQPDSPRSPLSPKSRKKKHHTPKVRGMSGPPKASEVEEDDISVIKKQTSRRSSLNQDPLALSAIMPAEMRTAWDAPEPVSAPEETRTAQLYLDDCHYYMWTQGKMLYIHRAETTIVDKRSAPQPLDHSLSLHEYTQAYHLERDVDEICMSPNDDRYIILLLKDGVTFKWRIDVEIRNWIDGLRRFVPKVSSALCEVEIRDILQCWQPHMQSASSSCFFYTLYAVPHLACNVYLETVTGLATPALMWFSHGGAAVSFALLPDTDDGAKADQRRCDTWRSKALSSSKAGGTELFIPGMVPRGLQIVVPGAVPDNVAASGTGLGPGSKAERKIHVIGAYLSDLEQFRHDIHDNNSDESGSRYCLELSFSDGVRLKLCYNCRFMRMACQQNLARLRALVDPLLPEVQMASSSGFKKGALQAMGLVSPANGAFVTGNAIADELVDVDDFSPAPMARIITGTSLQLYSSEAENQEESEYQWRGLSGAMEIKILSASQLGLTQKTSALSLIGGPPEAIYSKPPLPCPKVTAYVAAQAPPQRIESRITPELPERSANPIWNSTYFFTVEYGADDAPPKDIRFEVWNVDGRNEFLGEVAVPFPLEDSLTQYHVNLKPNPVKLLDATKEVNGSLSVQISFKTGEEQLEKTIPREPRLEVVHPSKFKSVCGVLGVEVVRALGLRSADLLTSDPYCVVLAACAPRQMVSWKTTTKLKTLNPVWREIHEFHMNWPNEELDSAPVIKIEIWDWDEFSGDEFLGEVSFALPHGDGENLVDLEVQPNRSKSPNTVKGRLQARVYFKNQFQHDDKEGVLDPYEKAFCEYFGSRVVDEQFARTIAPPLVFFHFGWQRILFGQCRDAWRRASHELLASKAARGHKTRAQCYIELVSSFTFAVALTCVVLAFCGRPSELIAIIAGCCAAIFCPSLANVLANFVWHREEPLALVGRMGLGGRGWGVPLGWALFAFFASVVVVAGFLAMAEEDAVNNLWLSVAAILIGRLAVQPLFRGIRMTWLLSVVKSSKRRDWFIRLFPSIMTAHGALLQRLPSRLLAPSF